MSLAAQYGVVSDSGLIVRSYPGTQEGLNLAWRLADLVDPPAGVVVIGVTGIRPVGRDGWYLDEPLTAIRPGTAIDNKVSVL